MSVLLQGASRLLGGSGNLPARLEGLRQASTAARGRLDDPVVDAAEVIVERAQTRLRLSSQHTVVALAGATGSGKSSLFNALSGLDLATVGVRRPTTSRALACVWGPDDATALLDWLEMPARHLAAGASSFDAARLDAELAGLVLLDLPDHDSTEVSHHLEVDRLVQYADLLVWVLDPQKYADAAVHDRYLRPMATHAEVMVVVLNHADELPAAQLAETLADVRRLLSGDGLGNVPLLATSARTGEGVGELRRLLAKSVRDKRAARDRLAADVTASAERMSAVSGTAAAPGVDGARVGAVERALADAAGVPVVVGAVERAVRARTQASTGFPLTRWLGRLRRNPLRTLHLDGDPSLSALTRSSLPPANRVQLARVDVAVRELADGTAASLTPPWAAAVRRASLRNAADWPDALDSAVVRTELGTARTPWWARIVNVVQWLLFAIAAVGALWLAGLAALGLLHIPPPEPPAEYGIPVPTLLLVAGLLAGLVLAYLSRWLARLVARAKARRADRALRTAIGRVAQEQVVAPIEAELAAYATCREGLHAALRR